MYSVISLPSSKTSLVRLCFTSLKKKNGSFDSMPAYKAWSSAFPQMPIYKMYLSPHLLCQLALDKLAGGVHNLRLLASSLWPQCTGFWALWLISLRTSEEFGDIIEILASEKSLHIIEISKNTASSTWMLPYTSGIIYPKSNQDWLLYGSYAYITLQPRQYPAMTLRKMSNAYDKKRRQSYYTLSGPIGHGQVVFLQRYFRGSFTEYLAQRF